MSNSFESPDDESLDNLDNLDNLDAHEALTPYARLAARIGTLASITYGPREQDGIPVVVHEVHEISEDEEGRREFNNVIFSSFCAPGIGPFGMWNYRHGSRSVSVVWWGDDTQPDTQPDTQLFVESHAVTERIAAGGRRAFGFPEDCSPPDSAGLSVALRPGGVNATEYFKRVGRAAAVSTAIEYAMGVLDQIAQFGDTSEPSNE